MSSAPDPPKPLPPDENMGTIMVIVAVILSFFAATSTVLRLWVRKACFNLGWDDFTIAASCLLGLARVIILSIAYGRCNGRHVRYLTEAQTEYINMLGFYALLLLFPAICLAKASICLLILRMKETKGLRWLLGLVMAGLVATNLECITVMLAQCDPISGYWNDNAGACWNVAMRIDSIYVQVST